MQNESKQSSILKVSVHHNAQAFTNVFFIGTSLIVKESQVKKNLRKKREELWVRGCVHSLRVVSIYGR